jgi:hypothetical protein
VNVRASASNLTRAAKDLALEWQQTQNYWRDAKSLEFEKTYLADLPHHIARATAIMNEIDEILRKVRTDCE